MLLILALVVFVGCCIALFARWRGGDSIISPLCVVVVVGTLVLVQTYRTYDQKWYCYQLEYRVVQKFPSIQRFRFHFYRDMVITIKCDMKKDADSADTQAVVQFMKEQISDSFPMKEIETVSKIGIYVYQASADPDGTIPIYQSQASRIHHGSGNDQAFEDCFRPWS